MIHYNNGIRTKDNLIYSIDNVVLDFRVTREEDWEAFDNLLDKLPYQYAVTVKSWASAKFGSFRDNITITMQGNVSFWIGMVFIGKTVDFSKCRLDFNPNKVANHAAFRKVLLFLTAHSAERHRAVKRFDLAIDIPVPRSDFILVKDNRVYSERRYGQEWTQYLGAKSSTVGRVKLYNKQAESKLSYPLTRLELTLDPTMPFEKISFPKVYFLDGFQLRADGVKVTETQWFIIGSLSEGVGRLDLLGRKMREKVEAILEEYIRCVELPENIYGEILNQLRAYKTGTIYERYNVELCDDQVVSQLKWVQESEKIPVEGIEVIDLEC